MNTASISASATPWRVIGLFLLAMVAVLVASHLPLPGMDLDALRTQMSYRSDSSISMFSIFAIGIMPLFTALACAEFLRLLIPPVARWQASSSLNARRMDVAVAVVALLLTVMQGQNILAAFATAALVEPGTTSLVLGLASYVAVTALLFWLSGLLRLPGFDSGIWALVTVTALASLPASLAHNFALFRSGSAPTVFWINAITCVVATTIIAVNANVLIARAAPEGGSVRSILLRALLWPPALAFVAAGYLIWFFRPETFDWQQIEVAMLAITSVLMPLFVWAYSRRLPPGRESAGKLSPRKAAFAIGIIQVTVCGVLALMQLMLGSHASAVLPSGPTLIACVTVLLALAALFTGRASDPA